MGYIVNPRGTGGSGKTELLRRIMGRYGWKPGADPDQNENVEPLYKAGRSRPYAYRLRHPSGGRPLVVLGHYEVRSGGCDTIRVADGGLAEVVRLASEFAESGHDVAMEGLRLSGDIEYSAALAQSHDLQILQLNTPLQQCARNLVTRRRVGADAMPPIVRRIAGEHERIEYACCKLQACANVEELAFEDALARAEDLLGLSSGQQRLA